MSAAWTHDCTEQFAVNLTKLTTDTCPDCGAERPAATTPAPLVTKAQLDYYLNEVVTSRENTLRGHGPAAQQARQTHCKNGHEFTPENTYVSPKGHRTCRTCKREKHREYMRTWRKS